MHCPHTVFTVVTSFNVFILFLMHPNRLPSLFEGMWHVPLDYKGRGYKKLVDMLDAECPSVIHKGQYVCQTLITILPNSLSAYYALTSKVPHYNRGCQIL